MAFKKILLDGDVAVVEPSDTDPLDVGITKAQGISALYSRQDHVHELANDVVVTLKIDDAAVTVAKMSIDADLSFAKNEIQLAAIHNLTEAPADPVSGQIYYNTADKHLYIFQSA